MTQNRQIFTSGGAPAQRFEIRLRVGRGFRRRVGAPHRLAPAGLLLIGVAAVMVLAACGFSTATEGSQPGRAAEAEDRDAETTGGAGHERPHPEFELTEEELAELTETLPDEIAEGITSDARGFLDAVLPVLEQDPELTRLVNKDLRLPEDYRPEDLVELDEYRDRFVLNRSGMQLSERALEPLSEMVAEALSEGITLDLSSVYRSIDYQRDLFARYERVHGREQAERFSAEAGASEHHLGTAVDFGSITPEFADTPAGGWLQENAWRYGFSLSYPEDKEWLTGYIYEPWHYRYIGRPATELKRAYFDGIQHYMLVFLHEHRDTLERRLRS